MKITKVKAKSIITKSGLPGCDWVINPYTGCVHGCGYCYARFMKRFTNHPEPWGDFVDVKINAPELIPTGKSAEKFKDQQIVIGSVTDAYQPIEKKYQITRKILEKLIPLKPKLNILTKSDLVTRDADLIKQFKGAEVAVSMFTHQDEIRKMLEVSSARIEDRFKALEELKSNGIKTVLFVSPILPFVTNWRKIIQKSQNYVDEYWFENLNFYAGIRSNIFNFLKVIKPELVAKYQDVYSKTNDYWGKEEWMIRDFCGENKVKHRIYFHHKSSKN